MKTGLTSCKYIINYWHIKYKFLTKGAAVTWCTQDDWSLPATWRGQYLNLLSLDWLPCCHLYKGTVILTTWRDSPTKRCQIIFLKIFAKTFFNWLSHFSNCILRYSKTYRTLFVLNDPQIFFIVFLHMNTQKRKILRWFHSRCNNRRSACPFIMYQTRIVVSLLNCAIHSLSTCNYGWRKIKIYYYYYYYKEDCKLQISTLFCL